MTCLREEVATLRSLVNTLVARPHTPPAHSAVQVNPEVQKFLRGGSGRLDASPVFATAKVVLLQLRIVVVCGFVKIIAPAQDAMFMHDKPDHRRDIAVSEGVRPWSPQSVRVDSAMNIVPALSVLCTTLRGQVAHLQVATLLQVQDV